MASVIVGDTTIKGEETIISVTVGTPDGETLKYLINVFMLPPEEESSVDSATNEDPDDKSNPFVLYAIIFAVVAAIIVTVLYVIMAKRDEEIRRDEDLQQNEDLQQGEETDEDAQQEDANQTNDTKEE